MYLAMADQGGGHESFFWDNEPWIITDNLVAGDAVVGEQDKGKNVLDSIACNTPNQLGGDVAVPVAATTGKKRGGGGSSKNGKASGSGDEKGNEGKGGGVGESDHEIHIWTERERRKKMRNMFTSLHALLPQLPPKADKSTIVDEAVTYIKTLQQTLQKLQKQKLEKLHRMSSICFVDPSKLPQQKVAMDTRESFLADHGSSSNLATIIGTNPSPSSIPRLPTIFQTWTSPNVTLNVCGEDAHISVCSVKKPGLFTAICYALEKYKLEVVSAHVSIDDSRSMYMIQAHTNGIAQFPEAIPIEEIYKQAAAEIMLWVSS